MSTTDRASTVQEFAPGETIAEQGSPGGGWYVLLSGRVAVLKNGTRVAEFATRGTVFGEVSSILSRPRTATLRAVEATSVVHFEADLDRLVTQHPNIAKTVLVSLAKRLEQTTDALWVAVQEAEVTRPQPPS